MSNGFVVIDFFFCELAWDFSAAKSVLTRNTKVRRANDFFMVRSSCSRADVEENRNGYYTTLSVRESFLQPNKRRAIKQDLRNCSARMGKLRTRAPMAA